MWTRSSPTSSPRTTIPWASTMRPSVRLDRTEGLIVDAQGIVVLGELVGDERVHIQAFDQPAQKFTAPLLLQIHRDRLFTRVDGKEIAAHPILIRPERFPYPAIRITVHRVLKANYPHPVLCESVCEIGNHRRLLQAQDGQPTEDL